MSPVEASKSEKLYGALSDLTSSNDLSSTVWSEESFSDTNSSTSKTPSEKPSKDPVK